MKEEERNMSRSKHCRHDVCRYPTYGCYSSGFAGGNIFGGWWIWLVILFALYYFWNGNNKGRRHYDH